MLKLGQEVNIFGNIGVVTESSVHGFYVDFEETRRGHIATCTSIVNKYDSSCFSFCDLVKKHSKFDGLYIKSRPYCIFSECYTLEDLEKFIKILTDNKVNAEISIF